MWYEAWIAHSVCDAAGMPVQGLISGVLSVVLPEGALPVSELDFGQDLPLSPCGGCILLLLQAV